MRKVTLLVTLRVLVHADEDLDVLEAVQTGTFELRDTGDKMDVLSLETVEVAVEDSR